MSTLAVAMYAALLLVSAAAFWKGHRPERRVAIVLLVTFAVNAAPGWRSMLTGAPVAVYGPSVTLVIDIAQLAALAALAVVSRPAWTLFSAAFQLIATLVSFVRLTEGLSVAAYVTAQNTLWWLTLAALAFGVWSAASRTPEQRLGVQDPAVGTRA